MRLHIADHLRKKIVLLLSNFFLPPATMEWQKTTWAHRAAMLPSNPFAQRRVVLFAFSKQPLNMLKVTFADLLQATDVS